MHKRFSIDILEKCTVPFRKNQFSIYSLWTGLNEKNNNYLLLKLEENYKIKKNPTG